MSEKLLYKISIDNSCVKCGICSSSLSHIFDENDIGDVYVKKETIYEENLQEIINVQNLCIANAIKIEKVKDKFESEDLEKKIKNIISSRLENINIKEVKNKDCLLSAEEMEVEISVPSIISAYKFLSLESAEKSGAKELKQVYEQNADTVLKGALLKCKYDKIMKFVNRDSSSYFFEDFERELNSSITNINELVKEGWNKDISYKKFDLDLSTLRNYKDLANFDTSFWFFPTVYGEFSDYVGVDYNSSDKWRYEIKKEDITRFFEDVIFKSFDVCLDTSVIEKVRNYCSDYKEKAILFINEYKKSVYNVIPSSQKTERDKLAEFNREIEKLSQNFELTKQEVKEGKYIWFDMDWDPDYRFVFRSDARKASENRSERMEREYRHSFKKYAETIAENYTVEITNTINKYMSGIHNLCLQYDKKIKNNIISISLDHCNEIKIDLADVMLPKESQDRIERFLKGVCCDAISKVDDHILVFTTIDDMEVYIGESIFGRSKFATRYNYKLDDVHKIHDRLRKEHEKLANLIYSRKITNEIYRKIATKVKQEVMK